MIYDVIVLGTGGVGSAALYHPAQRGAKALGLDQYPGGHSNGSSHGATRVIRKAYFEHPNYVPLLNRAYQLWRDLEAQTGQSLYAETGLIEVGPPDGVIVPGVLKAANEHNLAVETIEPFDFQGRFPALRLPEGSVAVFEREAGFLRVEDCVLAHLQSATHLGADWRQEAVLRWEATSSGVTVETSKQRYQAQSLAIAAGAWSGPLLKEIGLPLRILLKHLLWYESDASTSLEAGFPCFFYETPTGYFYGFPQLDSLGLKVAEHSGGLEIPTPEKPEQLDPADTRSIESFLGEHIPGVSTTRTRQESCYYTMSQDEHFIVDHDPNHQQVSFIAGLSGHGFKFASVLGEALADLATGKSLSSDYDFLKLR
ncbi:MAG: N-methyl-L-tryptophan oxidase [Verrucomicrobiota bacterium]